MQREAERLARMDQGSEACERWLLDVVRAGLGTLTSVGEQYWFDRAARLVDNQLPGLAGRVRALARLPAGHPDWPGLLLQQLGDLYWLVWAFRNRAQLPPAAQQEVLQQVGLVLRKQELAAEAPPVADDWDVLGEVLLTEGLLRTRRSWLRGAGSGRYALVLEYAAGRRAFATPLVAGCRYQGSLAFYPGLLPLRALPVSLTFVGTAPEPGPPAQVPAALLTDYAAALARNRWLREWPVVVGPVVPARLPQGGWLLHQPASEAPRLPLLLPDDATGWDWLGHSGGHPLHLFGEWDGTAFRPLHSWPAPGELMPAQSVSRQPSAETLPR